MKKSIHLGLCASLMLLLGGGLAHATCSTTVITNPDGTKDIQTDCSASFEKTKNPDIIRNPLDISEKTADLVEKSQEQQQEIQDKTADQEEKAADAQQAMEDARAKQQDAMDRLQDQQATQREKIGK